MGGIDGNGWRERERKKEEKDGKKRKMRPRGKGGDLLQVLLIEEGEGRNFGRCTWRGKIYEYTKKRGKNQWTPQTCVPG
jgi:hypothetical protein